MSRRRRVFAARPELTPIVLAGDRPIPYWPTDLPVPYRPTALAQSTQLAAQPRRRS